MSFILSIIILLIVILLYAYIRHFANNYSFIGKLFVSLGVILLTLAVAIYPEQSFNSALDGIKMWLNIVCPSLLPFFIGSELLVSLGIVNFIGVLLEPIMRPLFNVPGCGSFPFIMSITSGYPVGSKIVAQLYNNKLCNKAEGQRLLSFCSTSGPLFMIGAIGVGMLNMKETGLIIAASHYLGALTVGILFRFYKRNETVTSSYDNIKNPIKVLIDGFSKEKRPIGLLLSEAVKNSVNTLLLIGGFIVLFSVIIKLMISTGIINIFSHFLSIILVPIGIDKQMINPITSGLFEVTVGSKLISSSNAKITQKIITITSIIGWSGFSIHAQVASMISGTDLKMSIYMLAKLVHSIISYVYCYLIISAIGISPILNIMQAFSQNNTLKETNYNWILNFTHSSVRFISIIIIFLCCGIIYKLCLKLYSLISH